MNTSNSPFNLIFDENETRSYTLPKLLVTKDGQQITSSDAWMNSRREEILELFNKYIYGAIPHKFDGVDFHVTDNDDYLAGKISMKTVTITVRNAGKSFLYPLYVYLPKEQELPVKTFLMINNRFQPGDELRHDNPFTSIEMVVNAGYGFAMFDCNFIACDENQNFYPGIMELFPEETSGPEGFGVISAWSFAVMRAVDYLCEDQAVDNSGIIVIGHSRGGKTSLWSAVNDTRIACACVNCSGCTGTAIARRKLGETIAKINGYCPHWFNGNYKQFNDREDELPVDQHMLVALVAPRHIQVASAVEDSWADPKGEYLSLVHAQPVFKLFGFEGITDEFPVLDKLVLGDHMSYHIRQGKHDLSKLDWELYLKGSDNWFKNQ